MEIHPSQFCILVASHLSNYQRINYFIECLESLIQQKVNIAIYVSISFQDNKIKNECLQKIQTNSLITDCLFIKICLKSEKTPQMRHYEFLVNSLSPVYKYAMFCDDDDTYKQERTLNIIYQIENAEKQLSSDKILAGLYESTSEKTHKQQRQEYWSYCVNINVMKHFYNELSQYSSVVNDKCCDVLFAEYLRRLNDPHLFIQLHENYYNYRTDNNEASITGFIKSNRFQYSNVGSAPSKEDPIYETYLSNWNDYVQENMHIYIHDVYLRTLVGCQLQEILEAEFLGNSSLIQHMDSSLMQTITDWHILIRKACNKIYEIPI